MSETVHYVGKLIYVSKYIGEDLELQCNRIMNNKELPEYYESYADWLVDESDYKYYYNGDNLYEVIKENYSYDEVFKSNIDDNGEINFQVKYYNGACEFTEALDEALNNLK